MSIFKSVRSLLDRFLAKKEKEIERYNEHVPAKDRKELKVDVDFEAKKILFRGYKRLTKGVCGRLTWKDFQNGRKVKQTNPAQIARCEANALRREPMFKEQDKARREAIAARREAPFVALATRCGRQAFHISNNGAHKP